MKNTLKQLSIFIENKSGTLIKVLELFGKAKIQIIASTIADTQDYGIYRVLCSAPCEAYTILKEHGINVQLTDVLAMAISALSQAGVNILYMYSFLWKGRGVLVMRTDESDKALEVIAENDMDLLNEDDFII